MSWLIWHTQWSTLLLWALAPRRRRRRRQWRRKNGNTRNGARGGYVRGNKWLPNVYWARGCIAWCMLYMFWFGWVGKCISAFCACIPSLLRKRQVLFWKYSLCFVIRLACFCVFGAILSLFVALTYDGHTIMSLETKEHVYLMIVLPNNKYFNVHKNGGTYFLSARATQKI